MFSPIALAAAIVVSVGMLESEQKSSRSETIREPVIGIPVWVMISACGRAERRKYVGNCDAVTAGGAIRGQQTTVLSTGGRTVVRTAEVAKTYKLG